MTKEDVKKLLEENFAYLSILSVKEYTLYRKWVDIQEKYPVSQNNTNFFDDVNQYPHLFQINSNIWVPKNHDSYLKLEPVMIIVKDKQTSNIWNSLRDMCHSAVWHASPGRLLRYFIMDAPTGKYLGFISLGSDFIGVGGRDNYIGWTMEDRMKGSRLRHTAMGSSIAAVQPFGHNYNGGKLMALLTASDVVQNEWKERYKEDLVGVTTTSLYGGASMYNRLSYWRKCKSTMGNISIEPSEDVYNTIKNWYKNIDPDSYKKDMKGSHPKTRTISSVCKLVGVKPPINNAPRGVYWNELFVDTKDFLCRRIDKVTKKKYDNSVSALTQLWKDKYANKRVENVIKDGRWSNDILFYEDMIYEPWETIKKKYLNIEV
jgi:hypothetical protein